jgi:hypothetical protein
MNFTAASHGISINDTFYPNPDKPELKIEDLWRSLRSVIVIIVMRIESIL